MDVFISGDVRYITASGIAKIMGVTRAAATRYLARARKRYGLPAFQHPQNRTEILYPLLHPKIQEYLTGKPGSRRRGIALQGGRL